MLRRRMSNAGDLDVEASTNGPQANSVDFANQFASKEE
jgi:hypothetical protein